MRTYLSLLDEALKHAESAVPACPDVINELEELDVDLTARHLVRVQCLSRAVEECNKVLDLRGK